MIKRLVVLVGALLVLLGASTLPAVDGASITWHSDDQRLSIGERAHLRVAATCPVVIGLGEMDGELTATAPRSSVSFYVDGANEHAAVGVRDGDFWTHAYDGTRPGADTVVAVLSCYGEIADRTGALTITWEAPEQPNMRIVPGQSSAQVGDSVTVAAELTAGGRPLQDAPVEFRASMSGQDTVVSTRTTDGGGIVRFTWTREAPGADEYTVSATVNGMTTSASDSIEWEAPPNRVEFALNPRDSSGRLGTDFTWTATVIQNGDPIAGAEVSFRAEMDGQPDVTASLRTDAAGQATHTHTRRVAGDERLTISTTIGETTLSDEGLRIWTPVTGPSITLTPSSSSDTVGEPFDWTATVTGEDGAPRSGIDVTFRATMPNQPDEDATRATGATGEASFSHTRDAPGVEQLSVSAVVDGTSVSDVGELTWAPTVIAEPTISLAPSTSAGAIGTEFVWTATVTDGDKPLPGVTVNFAGEMVDQDLEPGSAKTELDGRATHRHTRNVPGTEDLTVSAEVDGTTVTDVGSRTWTEPTDLSIELTPADSAGLVGTDFEWAATVLDDGEPVDGVEVTFVGEMAGQEPDVEDSVMTGADGRATYVHTRAAPGIEDLTVLAEVDGTMLSDTGLRTWVATIEEIPLEVVLEPRSSSGPVGSYLAWTAVVTSGGEPLGGATVSFSATMAKQPEATVTSTTNTEGAVTGSHTRTVSGAEQLTVEATHGSRQDTDTGTRTWTTDVPELPGDEPDPGPGPEITIDRASVVPGGDLEIAGTGCEPGATVQTEMASEVLGSGVAGDTGAFTARHEVPRLPLGQYVLTVACGSDVASAPIDLVVPTWSTPAAAGGVTTAALLAFFVLLGGGIVRNLPGQSITLPGA